MERHRIRAFLEQLIREIKEDNITLLSAALAFYTGLSVAPLLVLFLWLGSLLGPGGQQAILDEAQALIGSEGGRAIEMILRNATEKPSLGTMASIISLGVLLFGASRVFGQLQLAMNLIWDVRAKPRKRMWAWARKRLISLAMVASTAFLLLVSLILSAMLAFLSGFVQQTLPLADLLWQALNAGASLIVHLLLFAGIFKYLPDVRIPWSDVWFGALVTALLFGGGKTLIGHYLGRATLSSSYGAAGALIVFLLWVYYSSLTMFFGAEVTQVWARRHGSGTRVSEHAEWEGGAPVAVKPRGPRSTPRHPPAGRE